MKTSYWSVVTLLNSRLSPEIRKWSGFYVLDKFLSPANLFIVCSIYIV